MELKFVTWNRDLFVLHRPQMGHLKVDGYYLAGHVPLHMSTAPVPSANRPLAMERVQV
jgi:hypothetical protein